MKQQPPKWGVMFNDGSVMHPWNGRTQLHRALLYLQEMEETTDNITLAYRKGPGSPWVRVLPQTKE